MVQGSQLEIFSFKTLFWSLGSLTNRKKKPFLIFKFTCRTCSSVLVYFLCDSFYMKMELTSKWASQNLNNNVKFWASTLTPFSTFIRIYIFPLVICLTQSFSSLQHRVVFKWSDDPHRLLGVSERKGGGTKTERRNESANRRMESFSAVFPPWHVSFIQAVSVSCVAVL